MIQAEPQLGDDGVGLTEPVREGGPVILGIERLRLLEEAQRSLVHHVDELDRRRAQEGRLPVRAGGRRGVHGDSVSWREGEAVGQEGALGVQAAHDLLEVREPLHERLLEAPEAELEPLDAVVDGPDHAVDRGAPAAEEAFVRLAELVRAVVQEPVQRVVQVHEQAGFVLFVLDEEVRQRVQVLGQACRRTSCRRSRGCRRRPARYRRAPASSTPRYRAVTVSRSTLKSASLIVCRTVRRALSPKRSPPGPPSGSYSFCVLMNWMTSL